MITPASSLNQNGSDSAGVCISLDQGKTFHHSAFAGIADGAGPLGIACTSKDHCVAYGGLPSNPGSAYIFTTNNASSGKASTWTKATTPTLPDDTQFKSAAFAPDAMTGWIVGIDSNNGSLLFTTTDGGATWIDASASIQTLTGNNKLHSVYAFDATHVWIGGEEGTLITSGI